MNSQQVEHPDVIPNPDTPNSKEAGATQAVPRC